MKYKSRISSIEVLNQGIVRVLTKANVQIRPEDLKENLQIYREILGEEKAPFLSIMKGDAELTEEKKLLELKREKAKFKQAEAIVLEKPLKSNTLLYASLAEAEHPIQVFHQENAALEWLKKYA